EVLIEANGFGDGRILIVAADVRRRIRSFWTSCFVRLLTSAATRVPRDELLRVVKNRTARRKLEVVLGLRRRLLAARVKLQRLVRDEVVERRSIIVGQRSFLQEIIERRDGRLLERVGTGQRLLKLLVDLREKAWQVPGGEVLRRRGAAGRTRGACAPLR